MSTTPIKLIPSTNQDAFDMVVEHLARMERQAGYLKFPNDTDSFVCSYYDKEGNRCAIGGILTEPERLADVETEVYDLFAQGLVEVNEVSIDLLESLQQVHDNTHHWNPEGGLGWQGYNQLAMVANAYGLDTTRLERCSRYVKTRSVSIGL